MNLQVPPDARPVPDAVRDGLLEPLIAAASLALAEMAQVELAPLSAYGAAPPRTLGDVSARLRLTSGRGGVLVLGSAAGTASALAGRVLAGAAAEPGPELVRDCMGEVANVVAGQAKALLHDSPYRFTFGTPAILEGAGLEVDAPPGAECLVVVLGSEIGPFALQLCLDLL